MRLILLMAVLSVPRCWGAVGLLKNVVLANFAVQTSTLKAKDRMNGGKATFYSFPYSSLSLVYKRIDFIADIKLVVGAGISHHPITKTKDVDLADWNKILPEYTLGGDWAFENFAYSLYYHNKAEIIPKASGVSTVSFPSVSIHYLRPELTWRPQFKDNVFVKAHFGYGRAFESQGIKLHSAILFGFEIGHFWLRKNDLHGLTLKGEIKKIKSNITEQTYFSIGPSYLMSMPW